MIIFLIFLFLIFPSQSFTDQIAYTETGQKVVLHDDGTWEYVPQITESSQQKSELVELNRLEIFPQRYEGKYLSIKELILSYEIKKDRGHYCIAAWTKEYEFYSTTFYEEKITFVLPLDLVEKWIDFNSENLLFHVNVEGTFKRLYESTEYWSFFIHKIHVISLDGSIGITFESKM